MYTVINVFYGLSIDESPLKNKYSNSKKADEYYEEVEDLLKNDKVKEQSGFESFYVDGDIVCLFGVRGPEIECVKTIDLKFMKSELVLPKGYKLKYKELFEKLDDNTKRVLNMLSDKPTEFVIFSNS